MPIIRVHGFGKAYQTNLTTSVLNTLLKNGFPIQTICGGRALCGRDMIRVLEGAGFLSPQREAETKRLAELARHGEPSGTDIRLACQTYARGDIEIEVIHVRDRT